MTDKITVTVELEGETARWLEAHGNRFGLTLAKAASDWLQSSIDTEIEAEKMVPWDKTEDDNIPF